MTSGKREGISLQVDVLVHPRPIRSKNDEKTKVLVCTPQRSDSKVADFRCRVSRSKELFDERVQRVSRHQRRLSEMAKKENDQNLIEKAEE